MQSNFTMVADKYVCIHLNSYLSPYEQNTVLVRSSWRRTCDFLLTVLQFVGRFCSSLFIYNIIITQKLCMKQTLLCRRQFWVTWKWYGRTQEMAYGDTAVGWGLL